MPPEAGVLHQIDGELAFELSVDGDLMIGRDAASDLVLDDSGVSRTHCRVRVAGSRASIVDLGSANGTFVERDGRVQPASEAIELIDGDIVRIGPRRLRYESPEHAAATSVAASADPLGGRPWGARMHVPTVAAGFSLFAVGFFVWALPAVLASDIAATHGMSAIESKILPATAIMFGAVARLGFGFVTDARGPLPAGAGALLIATAALLVLALLGGEVLFVWIGVALLGVGLAALPIALPLVSQRTAPERRGLALGIMASGSVGIVLAALAGPALADALDWRDVFALALIPAALGAAVFLYGARGDWSSPPGDAWRPMARSSDLRLVALLFGITFGTFAGLYTVLPSVLQAESFGLSVGESALIVAMGALAGAGARVIGGSIADRVGSHRVLIWVMAITTVLLALAGIAPLALALTAFILTMASFDAGTSAVLKLAAQSFGRTVGAGVGIISAVGGLFGFAISLVASSLFESTESAVATFAVLALAPLLAGAMLALIIRRRAAEPRPSEPRRLELLDPYGAPAISFPILQRTSIGRAPGSAIWFRDDDFVSRSHAQLELANGDVVLRDLGSTNGTMMWRGERWISVEAERLVDGDVVVIGTNVLRYRKATGLGEDG